MNKMTAEQRARWERIRQGGCRRFILLYGVLAWGVPTGVLWAVGMAAISEWDRLPQLLAMSLVGFPLGGILFGWVIWKIAEASFRRAAEEDETTDW